MISRVLVVDDDTRMCELVERGLRRHGHDVTWRTSADEAIQALAVDVFDCVVTDLKMRGMDGIGLCAEVAARHPEIPVLVITAFGSLDSAVAAMRAGAYDFLTKPFEIDELHFAVQRAVDHKQLCDEVKRLRQAVDLQTTSDDGIIGSSDAVRRVREMIARIAASDAGVLVTGESGTGKELVARAVHRAGQRKHGPFVAVNCAAMPENLLETELFGHSRGAFTDARAARTGLFLQAQRGTIFLDEIGDLPRALQPKLLRALQERCVRPVGADTEVAFDARVIAATNHDLASAVEEGRFREDLYFRINVIEIEVPPLRSRGGDVLLLAQEFVRRSCEAAGRPSMQISPAAAERLLVYPWPGNVRELQNCIERAVTLSRYDQISVEDFPESVRTYRRSHVLVTADDPSQLVSLEEVERRYVARVMEAVAGNKTLAARVLGLDRKTLYRKLERIRRDAGESES